MKYLRDLRQKNSQFSPVLTAVILVAILPLCVGITFLIGMAFLNTRTTDSTAPSIGTSRDSTLPDTVANAVLQDAAIRSDLPLQELRIVESQPHNWSDGCLELAPPDTFCTQTIVSGWRVTVKGGRYKFIYRTDEEGSLVKLESNDFKDMAETQS